MVRTCFSAGETASWGKGNKGRVVSACGGEVSPDDNAASVFTDREDPHPIDAGIGILQSLYHALSQRHSTMCSSAPTGAALLADLKVRATVTH
jgi:hypothetical protein